MKNVNIFLSLLFLLFISYGLDAQKLIRNHLITGVTYAGDKVNKIYIPPPEEFYLKSDGKSEASVKIYYSGFPNAAILAMEYAASILKSVLPDDTDITVLASWENITTKGVLANSSTTGYAPGWEIDAQNPVVFYPATLAEKISGKKLNFDLEGDIVLVVNSSVNWYYGTDGKTPLTNYDLVTVVIHELIHGLGFFDSMNTEASEGYYGAGSVPLIYDTFVENLKGEKLTDTAIFDNPSSALKNELTGGNLYFNGPLLKNHTSGGRAKLYAPSSFDPGSSIAHLDENSTLPEDQLMTPFINRGEAIHNPGKYTMSMLGDLGWINTRISHESPKDTEEKLTEINLTATIISDTLYFRDKVGLVWSFDKFSSCDTMIMSTIDESDQYTATVQIPSYETNLEYYIFVEDSFNRTYRSPSHISEFRHSVYIGTDTILPLISHVPAEYYFEVVDSVRFESLATDNIGIDTVYLEYRLNDGPVNYLGLINDGNERFSNLLNIKDLSVTSEDSIGYRIVAVDNSSLSNIRTLPSEGYFFIRFERINDVVTAYDTDFQNSGGDFFNTGFEITIPAGFTRWGLHTKHPYESPEETGDSIGYTAMLRTPVKFDASGMIISFFELVLVEPGEAGSVFGSQEFYDYVIVEASTNYGKTWFPLTDGYDSRIKKVWESAYDSSIVENNSTYQGRESMLEKHSLFLKPSSDINAGDIIVIRFRLFSDPYANGWGWCIENLHIGPLIDNIENVSYFNPIIYPNPGNGKITMRRSAEMNLKPLRYSIFNSTGTYLVKDRTDSGELVNIDISGQPAGIYFIVFHYDHADRVVKYILIR